MMTEIATEIIECPICMDEINGEKNKVTTECGHCFHTSCLMKNVSHNGFKCPYCRDTMAEEVPDEDEDEYEEFSIYEDGPDYNDHVLRGARWLFQRAEGEEPDDDTESDLDSAEEERDDEDFVIPFEHIAEMLIRQGVTYADLVKSMLIRDHDEYQGIYEYERLDNKIFGKVRSIISNYEPPNEADIVDDDI